MYSCCIGKTIWSSSYWFTVDTLGLSGEEGRGNLRKASGRRKHPIIRRLPNGVTQRTRCPLLCAEYIGT